MSKLAAIFQFYFDSLSPNTASYSLQYPYTEGEKGWRTGLLRSWWAGWQRLPRRSNHLSAITNMYRGKGVWKPGWRHEPVPITYRSEESSKLEISVSCSLHRSLKSRWRRLRPTTTKIGSLPIYPNSSDPGYAGRSSSSKSQMGRSLWLE